MISQEEMWGNLRGGILLRPTSWIGFRSGDPVHSACDQRNLKKVGQATSSPLEVVADARCGS
ncbi:hypothetical protein XAB3213_2260001 [Xanthomonas citri pv. bilvae]|nr:hypothetical protein XAB3213_2260001 [Xanthomonas citri pv. bilvae]